MSGKDGGGSGGVEGSLSVLTPVRASRRDREDLDTASSLVLTTTRRSARHAPPTPGLADVRALLEATDFTFKANPFIN